MSLATREPTAVAAWPASDAVAAVIAAGRFADMRGWVPATSGNLSARSGAGQIAITASGMDKGALQASDVMLIPLDQPAPPGSSAETGLHLALYRRMSAVGAIVHVHSPNATVLSRRRETAGEIVLENYELLKAFAGIRTHATRLSVPVFANSQDIDALSKTVDARLGESPTAPGYLLASHGLYAWGATMREALRHAEAFEFLFGCALAGERS